MRRKSEKSRSGKSKVAQVSKRWGKTKLSNTKKKKVTNEPRGKSRETRKNKVAVHKRHGKECWASFLKLAHHVGQLVHKLEEARPVVSVKGPTFLHQVIHGLRTAPGTL